MKIGDFATGMGDSIYAGALIQVNSFELMGKFGQMLKRPPPKDQSATTLNGTRSSKRKINKHGILHGGG